MRWGTVIVGVVLAIVIAIFAAGAVLPRKHAASVAVHISQPPQIIWQTVADHAGDSEWRPDLKTIQRLPDRNGHPVWLETYKNDMKLELEDVDAAPPEKLVREVRDTGNMFSGRWRIVISPDATGSVVRITELGEVPNPFFRFMSRFVFGHTKSMEQYLGALAAKFGEKAVFTE